jgi:DNA-binding transcriptional LysR family regulator
MIRELKTFVSVVKTGTFAAAGQQIGLTQSAVSAQIKHLEQVLGIRLFDRSGRAAIVNSAGERAFTMAEEILRIFARMGDPQTLEDFHGELKIGAIGSVQSTILPKALVRLRQQAPNIEPKLIPGVSLNFLSQVDSGEIDIAIIIHPPFPLPKEIHSEVICTEEFVLIVPEDVTCSDPLAILQQQPLVRYDRTSFGGKLVTQFLKEHRLNPIQALELDELDAIVKMVEHGLGVSLLPKAGLWAEHNPRVRIIPLGDLVFHRELVIIYRHAKGKPIARELFTQCLRDSV